MFAQCPDGTPPPCAARVRPGAAVAIDPNRVAIMPFRVTTTDTLLGEGFAELLATQFTGEGGPRALDMATVLSAWRHAGGGLRSPLPRARAVQLGRELGAGLVTEGSIVGLGTRVTVTASLLSVPGGEVRGTTEPVSGPADSLDALLRRTTTNLMATVGGQVRDAGIRFTDSPDAMRAYLEGLSAWRRGRLNEAGAAFDRSIAVDSSFAQALYRRYLAANWGIAGTGPYARLAFARRAGLSQRERATLEALLGPNYPATRTLEERVAARQQITVRYPDSPDGWYFIGDTYFHFGARFAPTQYLEVARGFFERSAAIDSQATVLNHLVWIGTLTHDTALLRRTMPAYLRTDEQGRFLMAWVAAAITGDAAQLATLRRRPFENANVPEAIQVGAMASTALMPPRLYDEFFDRWLAAADNDATRAGVQFWRGIGLALEGRPAAAEQAWAQLPPGPVDAFRLAFDLAGGGAGLDVIGAIRRSTAAAVDSSLTGCIAAIWLRLRGDSTTQSRHDGPACARQLEAATLARTQTPEAAARLATIDSLMRASMSTATATPVDGAVLARVWEIRGDIRRAAAAAQYGLFSDLGRRMQGRLAAAAGDTATAVSAYRRYLQLNANPEPIVIPQRDSVRAELARLERR